MFTTTVRSKLQRSTCVLGSSAGVYVIGSLHGCLHLGFMEQHRPAILLTESEAAGSTGCD